MALASCQGVFASATVSPLIPTAQEPTANSATIETTLPRGVDLPKQTATSFPKNTSSITSVPKLSATKKTSPMGLPIINLDFGELYAPVFSIPEGDSSLIHYRGKGIPGMEITGPNAIAILPDDSFMIADLIANRLLHFDIKGKLLNKIELDQLGIVNVADLRVEGNELFLLEISLDFTPPRYRVNQLSIEGNLIASYDIPDGFHIENGLTGIANDCDGNILIEVEGGFSLFSLQSIQNKSSEKKPTGYYCNNQFYRIVTSNNPRYREIRVGEKANITKMTTDFGSIRILKVYPDGSLFLLREGVIDDPTVRVDLTVHYIGSDSVSQAVARAPIAEAYYYIMRNIAVNSKGNVFFLLPRQDSLDVVQLNFCKSINPLPPSTVIPQIEIMESNIGQSP